MTGIIKTNGLKVTYDRDQDMLIEASSAFRDGLRQLKEEPDDFDSDKVMCEVLEHLVANSELQWIDPSETGDLTDAPMLGICGTMAREQDLPSERYGKVWRGEDEGGTWYEPVLARWGWMSYAVTSLQEQLLVEGRAQLLSHA